MDSCKSSQLHQTSRRCHSFAEDIDCDLLSFLSQRCHEASSSIPNKNKSSERLSPHSLKQCFDSNVHKRRLPVPAECLRRSKRGKLHLLTDCAQSRQEDYERERELAGSKPALSRRRITSRYEDPPDGQQCVNRSVQESKQRASLSGAPPVGLKNLAVLLRSPSTFDRLRNCTKLRPSKGRPRNAEKLKAHRIYQDAKKRTNRGKRKRRKRTFVELPTGSHFDSLIRTGAFERHMANVTKR